jgi:dodecin
MAKKNKDTSVAKVVELSAASTKSFEDAIENGVTRANKTLKGITGAWVQDMKVDVEDGKITRYRVHMKVTFVLND